MSSRANYQNHSSVTFGRKNTRKLQNKASTPNQRAALREAKRWIDRALATTDKSLFDMDVSSAMKSVRRARVS